MTGPPVAAASPFYPLEGQRRPSGGHAIPDRATHIALTVRLVLLGFTRHTTEFLSRPPPFIERGPERPAIRPHIQGVAEPEFRPVLGGVRP